jgi:hypothetical protein
LREKILAYLETQNLDVSFSQIAEAIGEAGNEEEVTRVLLELWRNGEIKGHEPFTQDGLPARFSRKDLID